VWHNFLCLVFVLLCLELRGAWHQGLTLPSLMVTWDKGLLLCEFCFSTVVWLRISLLWDVALQQWVMVQGLKCPVSSRFWPFKKWTLYCLEQPGYNYAVTQHHVQ
jgi:hypothetical protein